MKRVILVLILFSLSAQGADLFKCRTVPNLDKLEALRDARTKIADSSQQPSQAELKPMMMEIDAGEAGHVLVLLVEFSGTNSFTWAPGESLWDPIGHVDSGEWDGTNYNNAAASQFFADYYGIVAPSNFTYTGPLHNEIPRPPSGDKTDPQWNSIWYPDFSPAYYEQVAFGDGVVFDFNREDGSHYYADHTGISVKNYYNEMSSGSFALSGDVFGWITLTNSLMHYAADSVPGSLSVSASVYAELDSNGAIPGAGDVHSLVVDACRAAALQYPEINWDDYDLDGDGEVDSLWIVTAGFGEASGGLYDNSLSPENRIWPHSHRVYPAEEIADGIAVSSYIVNPENAGVYVLGHEYGHALGAIDLYAYQEGSLSPGNWAIMCGSQSGFPEGFKPVAMDPYHLDGWSWLNPYSIDSPTVSTTVELYQSGTGMGVPAGMHRAARIKLEDQVIDLPVDPPVGSSLCWWGGRQSYDFSFLQPNYVPIEGGSAYLSIETAYEMEPGKDFLIAMASYYDFGIGAWSEWEMLSNPNTVDEYDGVFNFPDSFSGLTGTSSGYPSYTKEIFSLGQYAGKYVTVFIAHVTDGGTQLAGPFIGEIELDPDGGYSPYIWSADNPQDMYSEWLTVDGDYTVPHYYYLQWRNTAADGGYDNVLGASNNRFGQSTSGLLTWYINELYSDNEVPDYLADYPSYGAKGIALVVDAHPGTFFKDDNVWDRPCSNSLATYNNRYLNADAAFGLNSTALLPDDKNGGLDGQPFFTDSRNYCAGVERNYLNPTDVPPTFEWMARKFDGSVVTPSTSAYGCRAPNMPENAEIHRVWIDRDGEFKNEFEVAEQAGGLGNPLDMAGEYGWNFKVLEDKGTSAVVKIWNSHHNAPYPVLIEYVGSGHTIPAQDFLASPTTNTTVRIEADAYHHIDRLLLDGTDVPAAVGEISYTLQWSVAKNSSVYAFFAADLIDGSTIPKQWFIDQNIPLTVDVLTLDSDGDGLSNEDEYSAGTKANDASSSLVVSTTWHGETVDVDWDSQWNQWYAVDVSTNLLTDPFRRVLDAIPGEYETTRRTLPISNVDSIFFRVKRIDSTP